MYARSQILRQIRQRRVYIRGQGSGYNLFSILRDFGSYEPRPIENITGIRLEVDNRLE